jgi:hypothetical protein
MRSSPGGSAEIPTHELASLRAHRAASRAISIVEPFVGVHNDVGRTTTRGARVKRHPDFLIAGAMRSGTTSLHHWLRGHPAVHMADAKEVHYFDLHYDRGPVWYQDQFAGAEPGDLLGEATPEYLFLPWARQRMCQDLPHARVVVTLRDPVDRAWSHYCMLRARGREELSFADALDREAERLRDHANWSRYGYRAKGEYAGQLRDLIERQGIEKVLVLIFERDVVGRPDETFRQLCRFLGVEVADVPAVGSRVNSSIRLRSTAVRDLARPMPRMLRDVVGRFNAVPVENQPLPAPLRERLGRHFAGPNAELERLLGREIPEWRSNWRADSETESR